MKILIANLIATFAHRGQVRKISGEPYVKHPRRVAFRAKELGLSPEAQAAALLHDVYEDTRFPPFLVWLLLGKKVNDLVWTLTDMFTPEDYPHRNRAKRKELEALRYRIVVKNPEAKMLKLLDLEDNLSSFASPKGVKKVGEFVAIFGHEVQHLVKALRDEHDPVSRHLASKVHVMAQRGIDLVKRSPDTKHDNLSG